MLNMQSLLSQLLMSNQPLQAASSLLTPQQRQFFNQFQTQPQQRQAEIIAKLCNEKGITKEQYAQFVSYISGNKN